MHAFEKGFDNRCFVERGEVQTFMAPCQFETIDFVEIELTKPKMIGSVTSEKSAHQERKMASNGVPRAPRRFGHTLDQGQNLSCLRPSGWLAENFRK